MLPVLYATDVDLELAVVTQKALLNTVQVDRMVVNDDRAHAALIGQRGVPTALIG